MKLRSEGISEYGFAKSNNSARNDNNYDCSRKKGWRTETIRNGNLTKRWDRFIFWWVYRRQSYPLRNQLVTIRGGDRVTS